MLSDKQLEANRRNALKSTGPRTEAGRAAVRYSATKHNLTGQTVLLPNDDIPLYLTFCAEYAKVFRPDNPVEAQLVQSIADAQWRLNRSVLLQSDLLALGDMQLPPDQFAANHPKIATALRQALGYTKEPTGVVLLSVYDQRLANRMFRTMSVLKEMQAERRAAREAALQEALNLEAAQEIDTLADRALAAGAHPADVAILHGRPDPAQAAQTEATKAHISVNGFDFSAAELAAASDRKFRQSWGRNRRYLLRERREETLEDAKGWEQAA